MGIHRGRYVLPLFVTGTLVALAAAGCTAGQTPTPPGQGLPMPGGSTLTPEPSTGSPSGPAGTSPGQPPAGASPGQPPAGGGAVTIVRTGGFAGVWQSLTVGSDGRWTYHDRPNDRDVETGTLTAAQQTQLRTLLGDPALAAEAARKPGPPACADGFSYTLTTGSSTVSWLDCGDAPKTAGSVVRLLEDATAL
ncbi:protealysin inhibitor emfourin [Micromonospora sp. NPDC003197]